MPQPFWGNRQGCLWHWEAPLCKGTPPLQAGEAGHGYAVTLTTAEGRFGESSDGKGPGKGAASSGGSPGRFSCCCPVVTHTTLGTMSRTQQY